MAIRESCPIFAVHKTKEKRQMQKFIITLDGVLECGDVSLHRNLIPRGDSTCHGGGFWRVDNQRGIVLLYGRSFDFGAPEFSYLKRINETVFPASLGYPMFYQREFAGEEIFEPIGQDFAH